MEGFFHALNPGYMRLTTTTTWMYALLNDDDELVGNESSCFVVGCCRGGDGCAGHGGWYK
jgi:hypothetical protein